MAKKKQEPFKVGDWVGFHFSEFQGRIVEFRGPLGPGGALIYRVRVPHKPKPIYIEVREDQLVHVLKPMPTRPEASQLQTATGSEPVPPKIKPRKRLGSASDSDS
jgi:hypothetical protein